MMTLPYFEVHGTDCSDRLPCPIAVVCSGSIEKVGTRSILEALKRNA